MDFLTITGIALGLSLDAFAVTAANAVAIKNLSLRHGLRMALFFGFFQAIMPLIGWAAGTSFNRFISSFDHWIAFGLLAFIGGRMVWGGVWTLIAQKRGKDGGCSDEPECKDCRHLPTLFILAIATSIDALAVGLSFSMIEANIVIPVVIIGLVTFLVCILAYFLGTRLGKRLNLQLEIPGGLILILIGLKVLLDHLLH